MMADHKRSRPHTFAEIGVEKQMEQRILKYMCDHSPTPDAALESIDIAKGVGKNTKKDINAHLYSLEKRKLIKKVQESPPLWKLLLPKEKVINIQSSASRHTPEAESACQPPSREPSQHCTRAQTVNTQSTAKGDFQIPRTPQELLNDMSSHFSKISITEAIVLNDLEKRVLRVITQSTGISIEDILQYLPEFQDRDIQKALERLLATHCVIKDGHVYSTLFPPDNLEDSFSVQSSERTSVMCDFTSDAIDVTLGFGAQSTGPISLSGNNTPSLPTSFAIPPSRPLVLQGGKNAISLLNEYCQSKQFAVPEYTESVEGPDHKPRFWMTVRVGGLPYRGAVGSSKKDAKLKAAEAALAALRGSNRLQTPSVSGMPTHNAPDVPVNSTIHDKIAALVNQKYNALAEMLPDTITGRKVVAGIVMSRKLKSGETTMEVVSIGSGNRCVMGDKLSLTGTTVNDCHAEIIARRGLVRYLYNRLLNDHTLVMCATQDGRFQLLPDIEFHLYISTAPCGDSAIFAPSDASTDRQNQAGGDGSHHPIFENRKQGVLRTKIENGEGCIPIEEDTAAPTWDGILRGERLRTMSCSDKIAKWNYLGLQGSLLSHFLDKPIYLSTLTLGMLYNHGHLTRAVCCRVEKALNQNSGAPGQYKCHHPIVAGQNNHNRETGKVKTREFSLNWNAAEKLPEVLDGTTGRCEERFGSQDPPRLCKAQLFGLFKQLCDKKKLSDLYKDGYLKCKCSAKDYHSAKLALWSSFDKSGFGKWMSKPKDEKDFE